MMNKMMKMCVAAAMGATVAGCGKQRYEDPQAFMEGPGNEALCKLHADELAVEELGFAGFEFRNAKVEMDRFAECVSSEFSACPRKGVTFYELVQCADDCDDIKFEGYRLRLGPNVMMGRSYEKYDADITEITDRLIEITGHEKKFRPRAYGKKLSGAALKKALTPNFRLKIWRHKDGEGVYRVIDEGKDTVKYGPYSSWHPGRLYAASPIVNSKQIAKFKIPEADSKEFKKSQDNYLAACASLKAKLPELEKLIKEAKQINLLVDSFTGWVTTNWVAEAVQKRRPATDAALEEAKKKIRENYQMKRAEIERTILPGKSWKAFKNRDERLAYERKQGETQRAARTAIKALQSETNAQEQKAKIDHELAIAQLTKEAAAEFQKVSAANAEKVEALIREVRKLLGLPEERAADKQG